MISTEQLASMIASGTGRVVGSAGERIGKVGQLFLDDRTGRPEWVTAKAGLFSGESFIPLAHATLNGNVLVVPFADDEVKDAPRVKGEGGHLTAVEEARLYAYYGLGNKEPARNGVLQVATARVDETDTGLDAHGQAA